MVALPYLSAIRFSGTDAGDFLHNQLSADVLALSNGESVFGCYCEPKGRVLALMLVGMIDNDYYIILSDGLAQSVSRRLMMYVMRSKVSIEVLAEHGVMGLNEDSPSGDGDFFTALIPVPNSGQQLAVMPRSTAAENEINLLTAWKLSELERGIFWLNPETSGQFLPQMLGFDQLGAVNFRKGCYPGQEIVARTHYLGKVKRHPRLLNCKLPASPGPMDKVSLFSDGKAYDSVVADNVTGEDGSNCLLVVTRMEPDQIAEQIEFQGNTADTC